MTLFELILNEGSNKRWDRRRYDNDSEVDDVDDLDGYEIVTSTLGGKWTIYGLKFERFYTYISRYTYYSSWVVVQAKNSGVVRQGRAPAQGFANKSKFRNVYQNTWSR